MRKRFSKQNGYWYSEVHLQGKVYESGPFKSLIEAGNWADRFLQYWNWN